MENENLEQPHVEETATPVEVAAGTPHLDTEVTESKPAAENKVSKTFTQEEVERLTSERTSKLRTEADEARRQAAQLVMQRQIEQANANEAKARAKDQRDLESGNISEEQMSQRSSARQEQIQIKQTLQRQRQAADALGRVMLANELAKEYEINADDLINDQTLKDPLSMTRKASQISRENLKAKLKEATVKPESFDKGPGNTEASSGSISKMSPQEKIQWALKHQK